MILPTTAVACNPVFLSHVLSAVALFAGILLLLLYRERALRMASVLFLLSIAMVLHGQSHATLDQVYGYRPSLC